MNGLGPDAPVITNSRGAKQSDSPSRADLLPPAALLHIGAILKAGAAKYGEQNWRELDLADHINHAYVHILAHLDGDTQDDHLGHAACRMLFALETQLKAKPISLRTPSIHEVFALHNFRSSDIDPDVCAVCDQHLTHSAHLPR